MSENKRTPRPAPSVRPEQRGRTGASRPSTPQRPSVPPRADVNRPRSVPQSGYRPQMASGGKSSSINVGDHRFRENIIRLAAISAAAIVLAVLLQIIWPDGFPVSPSQKVTGASKQVSEIYSSGPFRLNEVMTANRYTLLNSDDESSDWIEVANVSNANADIGGWEISKTSNSTAVFTFPQMKLAPGECVLICADSRLRETAGEELHAPFRLSSGGDTLMLFNPAGTAVDTVNIPALNRDQSYIRRDTTTWEISDKPTPALENTDAAYREMMTDDPDSPIIITEIVPSNSQAFADENGQYNDYIELYNRSNVAVSLSGWYLSDSEVNPRKWRFPEVNIDPGQALIVFASGLDKKTDPAHLHTNFGLSSEGEQVILSDSHGRRMSSATFGLSKADNAWQRGSDGTYSIGMPSPGTANP